MPRGTIDRSFQGRQADRKEMSGRPAKKHFGATQHSIQCCRLTEAMMRPILGAAALVMLLGIPAAAQVIPGDSPNTGVGAAVANSPDRPGSISGSRAPAGAGSDRHGEQQYHEALRRIPDRKAKKDPWAGLRSDPAIERHRPQ
jgi:hypothetical protein